MSLQYANVMSICMWRTIYACFYKPTTYNKKINFWSAKSKFNFPVVSTGNYHNGRLTEPLVNRIIKNVKLVLQRKIILSNHLLSPTKIHIQSYYGIINIIYARI